MTITRFWLRVLFDFKNGQECFTLYISYIYRQEIIYNSLQDNEFFLRTLLF